MIITELIGTWRNDNYKKPASIDINRKNHDFKSLKELAEWSRDNYFLAFPQKEVSDYRRKEICNQLFLGTNFLWLDADYDVDVEEVKRRWEKANLRGFLYFTSRYYSEGIKRLRICVKVSGLTLENAKKYAEQVAKILNITKIDEHQYISTAYYAPVRIVDKNTLQSTTPKFKETDLWVFKGKSLELDVKPAKHEPVKQNKKLTNKKSEKPKPKELLSFGQFLDSLDCVESTTVRNNNTVNVIFKDIHEKTPNGYFINPYENAWKINHPNDKRIYASEAFKDDFEEYKQYILDNFSMYKPISESNPDEIIQTKSPYLKPSIFDNNAELLFIESPTGSGKTTSLSKWLLKQHKDKSILFISVNRAQAIQTHRALIKEGLDFECYLPTNINTATSCIKDNKQYYLSEFIVNAKIGIVPERLICGVLSLHHLIKDTNLHRNFDYVIIDEITTLPRAVIDTVSLMADNIFRFNQDMMALYYLLQNAQKVICLDGFIPLCIVKCIENISGKQKYHIRKDFRTDKRVEIYLTKGSSQPKLNGKITCKKFMKQLDYDISNSKNNEILLIALSYKKKAHELYNYIRLKHKLNIELITNRLTNKKDFLNFIKHLDRNLLNTDIMIYSPSITTGVNIPQAENTNVYHLIEGKHLSSHIHYQMTMRGRNASCYKILMPTYLFNNNNNQNNNNTNPEEEMLNNLTSLYKMSKTKLFNDKLFLTVIKENEIGMGVVLAYSYFKQLKIISSNSNKRDFKSNIKSKVSVYTAAQLEIANIALNNFDKEESTGQQYINLLAHEGCKVSVELDTNYRKIFDREKELKLEIKKLKLPVKTQKQTSLYSLKKKYCFAQKILHLESGYDKSSETIINTYEILKKAFKIAKLNFKTTNTKIHNDILVKIYDSICKNIISKNKTDKIDKTKNINENIDKLILDKFDNIKLQKQTKIRRVLYLLNLFFITSRTHRNSKEVVIDKNIQLHNSIQNMTDKHKRILYINDEINENDKMQNEYIKR